MSRKKALSPARRLLFQCRGQAEHRLAVLALPSSWPACLDLLDTQQTPDIDDSGRPLFYSRKEAIDAARVLYQTYCLEHWLKENDAERATASALELLELAAVARLDKSAGNGLKSDSEAKRQQVKKGDLRWWHRVAVALRKRNHSLSNLEIARRIDPHRHNTIRKYI